MDRTSIAKSSTIQYILAKLKTYFDKKSDRPTTLLLTIPTNGWTEETREDMNELGIYFSHTHQTQIKYDVISNVSAIVQLSSSISAKNAGMTTILEYDESSDGFLLIKFFAASIPNDAIQVSITIQY